MQKFKMCFEMEAQGSGDDIGPECLQSDDRYSFDAFSDIDALIVDLPDLQARPHTRPSVENSRIIERRCFRSWFDVGEYRR